MFPNGSGWEPVHSIRVMLSDQRPQQGPTTLNGYPLYIIDPESCPMCPFTQQNSRGRDSFAEPRQTPPFPQIQASSINIFSRRP